MSTGHGSTHGGAGRADSGRRASTGHAGTPVMPEVLDALSAAVARRAAPAPRRRRWLGRGSLLGVVVVLGSGTALAATGQWNPFAGTGSHDYIARQAPAADRATLGVLRKPQTSADRSALITAFLRRTGHDGAFDQRAYLPSVRALRPVETGEMGGWNGQWHRRTYPGMLVLMPSEVTTPAALEWPHASAAATRAAAAHKPQHALCMWTVADSWPVGGQPPMEPPPKPGHKAIVPKRPPLLKDRVTGGGTCVTLHQIRTKGVVEGAFNYGEITGIVPDGVASVRVTTRTGVVMTQKVINNSFQFVAPGHDHLVPTTINGRRIMDEPAKASQFRHQTLQWLAADGRIIRHVPL